MPSERRIIPIKTTTRDHQIHAVSPAPTFENNATLTGLAAPPPLALYVHWPWCVKKCPYCDFNSHEAKAEVDEAAYLAALIADLEAALPHIWNRPITSIFIGGGTPSLMSAETADALLAAIRMRVPLHADAEITLEANPGTAEAEKFKSFRAAGVNRLSLGIQSFNDEKLKALGRIHDSHEARLAIDLALTHFDRVNLDLMYALPQQSLAEAEHDIDNAIASGASHVSAYHLTLEPNTPFHHTPPPLPDDDIAADMQEMIEAKLAAAGFIHYETSAFAKPGEQCRHNLNYWAFGDYLGIGAGAHSKLSNHADIWREARHRHPRAYMSGAMCGDFISARQTISATDLPGEFMMNALRLTNGFPLRLFTERTGLPLTTIEKSALAARRDGLLETVEDTLRPTQQGQRFLNQLLARFLAD
ncbi:MAG TPA: radical SAM family heme chaperone HemW [Rugosibacter sp.]|nr:radical SAM family heme chaperone HemW [Rugosibacter sp.]HQQ35788.1 radical SAM family heme chaperone HemW [Rugosibacter sp.]